MKNLHNNSLYTHPWQQRRNTSEQNVIFAQKMMFSHSLMVPVGASKYDYSSLILLDLICNQLTPISIPQTNKQTTWKWAQAEPASMPLKTKLN